MTGLLPRRVLPVLMYHRVGAAGGDPALWISPEGFERHLEWISARGFRTFSLDEAYEVLTRKGAPPRRAVVLTFDDAFAETLETVRPLLGARRMKAAVFAPVGLLGREVHWQHPARGAESATRGRIADEEQLRDWRQAGHDVGSHGWSHTDLTRLPIVEARGELVRSKEGLEAVIDRPVADVCYPFAHHDEKVRRAAKEAGYRAAYAGEPPHSDLWAIPRMMVFPGDGEARYARKLSGYYYWWSAWHQRLFRLRRRSDEAHL